jgi:hypothetical protein
MSLWKRKPPPVDELRAIFNEARFTATWQGSSEQLEQKAQEIEADMRAGRLIQIQGKTVPASGISSLVRDFVPPKAPRSVASAGARSAVGADSSPQATDKGSAA